MIGRILWLVALLAVAAVTIAVQFDRQSAMTPQLAPLVPGPLRAYAQARVAAEAAQSEDSARALAEARALVRRRPVPAENLSLLAVAQSRAGLEEEAALTIQIAAQRGWREPIAQESVLRLALAAGDEAEAARRYAALFVRRETPDALLAALGAEVFAQPGGPARQTLAGIVADAERWNALFLRRGSATLPPGAFAEIVTRSTASGASFPCAELEAAARSLSARDEAASRSLAAAAAACRPA